MFKLKSTYEPTGDQPAAIKKLICGVENGEKYQTLLGVTGSGKTFTMANVIESVQKPTLILAHNKTLAGQLYAEFKELFPDNRVEFFISYYDYYQPEAYVSATDTYIEKDSSINDEIDEMRHSATASLLERKDVIVIASVSCIYGIGDPDDYRNSVLFIRVGQAIKRDEFLHRLVDLIYVRSDIDFKRGSFRVRGDAVEVIPASEHANGIRVEFFGDEVERIRKFDVLTGKTIEDLSFTTIYPGTHFVTNKEKLSESMRRIREEMEITVSAFREAGKLLEAQRLESRTNYDLEMFEEVGTCSGVENYSRHLALRGVGETPSTLMDFFGDDFLLIVDESHVTLPQVRGMYNGDRSRKQNLVDYGFRLPSALDNRPLRFEEFENKIKQAIFVSATPGEYETQDGIEVIEQIIRPTGLIDPVIEVRKTTGQIDDLVFEMNKRIKNNERTLITTLTIRMSEELTDYLKGIGMKVAYLHSEIKALERIEILRDLRLGKYDCLVGINLLREGLDLPEVSLIAILDADKQGFLRSERSLIQTVGRAARNVNGMVIMYADNISEAMEKAIYETNRRRSIQEKYNQEHGITPKTISKEVREIISLKVAPVERKNKKLTKREKELMINDLEQEMKEAAKFLDFEKAAEIRDIIFELKGK